MEQIRDTKIGAWLKEKAPKVFDTVADALPEQGVLGVIKNLVNKDSSLTHEQKVEFAQLEQQERIALENNITQRWQADVSSKSWLARNVRPGIVGVLTLFFLAFIIIDTFSLDFEIRDIWIRMYETILMTTIGGYFVIRSVDKNQLPWQR